MNFSRNELLLLEDVKLSALCTWRFCRGSGNGGQKRNKTSSAVQVRLTAEPELAASDCTERSQLRNRAKALAKLRLEIAFRRREPAVPVTDWHCSLSSPRYPLLAAEILDVLTDHGFQLAPAAAFCSCSPAFLVKMVFRDPALWQRVQAELLGRGLPLWHSPR